MDYKVGAIFFLVLTVFVSGCISQESTLTVGQPEGEGEITPKVGEHTFSQGEKVVLKAEPAEGWEFGHWQENGVILNSDEETEITIDEDKNITPVFEIPADFQVNLNLDSQVVKPGERVTAVVDIENKGGSKGNYEAKLEVNGVEEHSEAVELQPNETETIEFDITKYDESEYEIGIENESETLRVDSATYVSTLEELDNIRNDLDQEYALRNDIDASETENWDNGAGFEPIGNDRNRFEGQLDGQGHKITNLHINRPERTYTGLFGFIGEKGKVSNLKLRNIYVEGEEYTGGLAGVNNGEIYNSSVASTIKGEDHVGGLVGHNWDSGRVRESSSGSQVIGDKYIGGLVGDNDGVISDSKATGDVEGYEWTNGLVGRDLGEVTGSSSTGEVEGSSNVAYGEASMEKIEEDSTDLKSITYEELLRNPSDYKNSLIEMEGMITQITQTENTKSYHIFTDYSIYNTARATRYWDSGRVRTYWEAEHVEKDYTTFDIQGERLLEDDLVKVYGIFRGLHSYETVQGDSNTVPKIEIRHIEQIEEIE